MPASRTLRKLIFAGLAVIIVGVIVYAAMYQPKEWIVPEEAKARKNPLIASESNLRSADDLYHEDCANCHGPRGKGDGPEAHLHDPNPTDLSDAIRIPAISDGELFFKISEGHRPMPGYKRRLTEDQRWQLVLLIRTLSGPAHPNSGNAPAPH
jgi:mono/diheme cytochrome c family protein